ncbi:hypothetical protein [Streptomyces olivaceiscleroticus]|uniref:Uncharacterized protein n=1 Tax=Streptomyces olivaceiscleroticus TaxID=68245 RepID=A0ABN1BMB4_9ACTN
MQTLSKPTVTISAQPRPPAPQWQGLFLEPTWLPIDEDPADGEDDDYEDVA